ncbi:MAG TPA: zinc ribbon domain-containing protein [Steroidobacteraceae bacterium]|nr:zinc ribbon domain-containing protein [Steroidobacteraceae bacterium]
MSKIEWRVDNGTHIVVRNPTFSRRKVELNGQPVDGEWDAKRFDFKLADGRAADIELKSDGLSRQTELRVAGKLIPDARFVPKDLRCPACKAEIQLLDEFCSKCGHELGAPERFVYQGSVQGATSAIRLLAALFAIFGVIMFFVMGDQTDAALKNLSQFEDHEILQPIDGVTYTAGELRTRVVWEHRGVLIVNLMLSAIMLVLAWWSRWKALPAILIATAIYVAVQVVSAIVDPQTIAQGIIIKVVVIAVLVKGIKGALSLRTENG